MGAAIVFASDRDGSSPQGAIEEVYLHEPTGAATWQLTTGDVVEQFSVRSPAGLVVLRSTGQRCHGPVDWKSCSWSGQEQVKVRPNHLPDRTAGPLGESVQSIRVQRG